jgi:rare lipoprotein A
MIRAIAIAVTLVAATPTMAGTCIASQYGVGDGYHGKRTTSGERFNAHAMTAAHRSLPFGARVKVCYRRCVVVRISDRGPFVRGRCLDLSHAAAVAIGMGGTAMVNFERVN